MMRLRRRDESGFALITVIGIAGILAILTAVIAAQAVNNVRQAGVERRTEQAVHAADAGVDRWIAQLRVDPKVCNRVDPLPATFTPSERQWVLDTADAMVAADSANLIRTPEGDHVVIKPGNGTACPYTGNTAARRVVYSVAYTPAYNAAGNVRRIRIVRADYDFLPVPLDVAILTEGDIDIQGGSQTNITGAKGAIHANGDVTVGGNNASVENFVTATGSCGGSTQQDGSCGSLTVGDTSGTGGAAEERLVPDVNPRDLYTGATTGVPFVQYDLCPAGEIRGGPAHPAPASRNTSSPLVPCQGPLLADVDNTGPYRGWDNDPSDELWTFSGSSLTEGGVFYAYQRNVYINPSGGGGIWEATVITEGNNPSEPHSCTPGHTTGDITVAANTDMRYYPGLGAPNMLISSRVLDIGAGVVSGSASFEGFMFAHERFVLSGGADIGGAIVAKGICATEPNEIQGGVDFEYNGNAFAPPDGIPTITHWLEL